MYSFRGQSPTWTTTAPNVRSTPGPVVSNGKWLAIPSQGFSVLLDVDSGEVVPGSYSGRSNIYLPENTTPIATMGRYDGNGAAVFLDYIFSVGISNIRVTDPTTGNLVKELGFKQAVPSGCLVSRPPHAIAAKATRRSRVCRSAVGAPSTASSRHRRVRLKEWDADR